MPAMVANWYDTTRYSSYTPLDLKNEKETNQEVQNSQNTDLGLADYNIYSKRTRPVEPELQLHSKEGNDRYQR